MDLLYVDLVLWSWYPTDKLDEVYRRICTSSALDSMNFQLLSCDIYRAVCMPNS